MKSIAPGSVEPLPSVSVGLLTHVPYLAGYHLEQLDVVKLSILSARANAGRPIYLMVVDNGSCKEMRQWLSSALDGGLIDSLTLNSTNLGKTTAMSQIILGAPGPDVVYADGDIQFCPGWLEPMLRISSEMDGVGVVGGMPYIPQPLAEGRADVEANVNGGGLSNLPSRIVVERGHFLSEEVLREFLLDTGFEGPELEHRLELISGQELTRYRQGEVSALDGSGHAVFLINNAARKLMEPHVGSKHLDSDEDRKFDLATERTGLLRVSVEDRIIRHIGNRLTEDQRTELEKLSGEATSNRSRRQLRSKALWWFPIRRSVRFIHDWTFRILYETKK